MTNLLRINTSVFDGGHSQGVSTELGDTLLAALQAMEPGLQVSLRDFAEQPLPHLDAAWLQALTTAKEKRTTAQQNMVNFSDQLIHEIQQADVLMIAAPMYNFTIPSMLKAWVDHIARAGTTFKYTEQGPVGLLGAKKVYVLATTGGIHEEGVSDFVRPYLRTALGLLGLTDIEFISAAGLNMGTEQRQKGLQQAQQDIKSVAHGFDAFLRQRAVSFAHSMKADEHEEAVA